MGELLGKPPALPSRLPNTRLLTLSPRALGLDPRVGSEAHLELALRYLEEGRALLDRDPAQASGKLYKAAEEVVRALAIHFNLGDILRGVSEG